MTDLLNKIKFTRLPEYFQKAVGFETYNRLQYFKEYQDLLDFTEADNLEFAARVKAPKIGKKITQKGGRVITCDPAKTYPCGNVCRGQDKPCKNPIEGQAKTYIEFLKLQTGGKQTPAKDGAKPKYDVADVRKRFLDGEEMIIDQPNGTTARVKYVKVKDDHYLEIYKGDNIKPSSSPLMTTEEAERYIDDMFKPQMIKAFGDPNPRFKDKKSKASLGKSDEVKKIDSIKSPLENLRQVEDMFDTRDAIKQLSKEDKAKLEAQMLVEWDSLNLEERRHLVKSSGLSSEGRGGLAASSYQDLKRSYPKTEDKYRISYLLARKNELLADFKPKETEQPKNSILPSRNGKPIHTMTKAEYEADELPKGSVIFVGKDKSRQHIVQDVSPDGTKVRYKDRTDGKIKQAQFRDISIVRKVGSNADNELADKMDLFMRDKADKISEIKEKYQSATLRVGLIDEATSRLKSGRLTQEQYDNFLKTYPLDEKTKQEAKTAEELIQKVLDTEFVPPKSAHEKAIEKALQLGEKVPDEVLKDYPELKKQYQKSETGESTPKSNTATTKPEKEVATTAAKETKTEPLSEFESKFPKGMIRNSQTYRDLVNAKKGDVIPVMGMMGEGEIVKINPPSKSRPYGSVSVKPTEKAKEYYKKGNWDVPKQETYDLDLMSDHHTRLRKSGGKPPEKLSSKPDVISPDRLKPTGLNGVGDTFKPTKPPADFKPVKSTENTTFKGDSTKAAIVDKMPEINSPKIAEIAWELEQRKAHQNKLTKPFGNGNPDDPYVVNSSKIFRLEQQLKDTIQEEVNKQIGEGKLKLPYWMPKTDKIPNHKPGKAPEAGITADELEEASKRIKYENGYYIPEGLDSSGNKVGRIGGYIKNRGEALEVAITNGRLTQARRLGLEARDGYVVGFDMPKDWDGSVNGVKRKVKELREQEGTDTPAKEIKPRNTNLITDKGEKIPLSPQEIKVLTGRDKLSASDKTILSKNPSIVMLSKRIAETGDDKLMRKWEGRALVPGKGIDSSIAKEMLKDIDDFEAGKGKTATAAKETKPAASTSGEERSRSAKKQKVTKVGSYELTDDDIALLPWRTKQLLGTKSGRDELGKNKELLNLVKEISSSGDQELIDKYKKSGVNKSTFNDTYSKVRDDIYASKRKRGIETDIDRQIRQAKELEELERQDDLKRKNAAKQAKEESIKRAKASGAAPLDKDNLEKGESLSSTQSKKEFLEQYRDNYVKTANATDYDTEKADKTLLEVIDSDKTASEIAKLKNKIAVDKDLKERGFKASGSGTEGRLSVQVLKETKAKLKSLEDRQNKVDDFILKGGFHQGLPPFMSETPSDAWSGFVPPSPKAMQKAYDLAQQRRDQLVKNQSKTKSKSFTEPNTPFVWDRKVIAFYRDYPLNKTPSLINR